MVKQLLACICFLFASVNLSAGTTVDLRGVRLWSAPDNTRVVFDVSGTVSHTLFSLDNPERYPPTYHLGTESAMPWLAIHDDLPRTMCRDSPSLIDAYRSVGEEVP